MFSSERKKPRKQNVNLLGYEKYDRRRTGKGINKIFYRERGTQSDRCGKRTAETGGGTIAQLAGATDCGYIGEDEMR